MFRWCDWWFPDGEAHLPEYLAAQPGYQQVQRDVALGHVRRFGTAVDVGAHVGLWSRDLASRFARVHAFEPVAAHADCFGRNVPEANVVLHRHALGREDGFVEAEVATEGNSGSTYVFEVDAGIPCRRLDSLALPEVDFLKIDVEGFELFVCEGARETLLRCRPVVVLEQKDHATELFGVPQYAARDFVCGLGARVLERLREDWVLGWPER